MFREAHAEIFGSVDKYFSPFIQIKKCKFQRPSQFRDIKPEHARHHRAVPQYIGNSPEDISFLIKEVQELGYSELNINMGCPYPMVTNRKHGSGILPHPELAEKLLETACGTDIKVSIKCRLGLKEDKDIFGLIDIFNQYPLSEIIIHPRIASQMYSGICNTAAFKEIQNTCKHTLVYNGDINSADDFENLNKQIHPTSVACIGRGVISNPFLPDEINKKHYTDSEKLDIIYQFLDRLLELCISRFTDDKQVIKHLHEFWTYFHFQFSEGKRILKSVKKSRTISDYKIATQLLNFKK